LVNRKENLILRAVGTEGQTAFTVPKVRRV